MFLAVAWYLTGIIGAWLFWVWIRVEAKALSYKTHKIIVCPTPKNIALILLGAFLGAILLAWVFIMRIVLFTIILRPFRGTNFSRWFNTPICGKKS